VQERKPAVVEKDLSQHTWDELTSEAQQGLRGQGAIVEAMHRLTVRLDVFSASSDRYSNSMFWLNIILVVLTVVQAAAVIKTWLD
jgi:hypothetical protein